MAPGLADGVPARGDPRAATTSSSTRSSTSRWSSCAPRTAGSGVPERLPPPRRPGRRGPRHLRERVHLPVPRLVLRPDGTNTVVPQRSTFSEHNLQPGDIDLVPVRCETWGGCAWINLDDDAPPLRECIEPVATDPRRLEGRVDARRVVVRRAGCPVNWKLAQEAFLEQYHVLETHPQLVDPRAVPAAGPAAFDPRLFVEAELQLPPHDERGHGRHGPRQRRAHRRGPARHRAARRRRRPAIGDLEPHAQRRRRALAPRRGPRRPRPQRARGRRGATSRWATASPTSSCCRCTAARRRTASARSGRRRR